MYPIGRRFRSVSGNILVVDSYEWHYGVLRHRLKNVTSGVIHKFEDMEYFIGHRLLIPLDDLIRYSIPKLKLR